MHSTAKILGKTFSQENREKPGRIQNLTQEV
jgi:hypothetical protein